MPPFDDMLPDIRYADPLAETDDLYLVVHPGHGMARDDLYENLGNPYRSVRGLRTEDYARYLLRLGSRLRAQERSGTPVAVMYPRGHGAATRELLDRFDATVEDHIPTSPFSAHLDDDATRLLAATLSRVRDGGTVRVAGELNGLCYDQAVGIVDEALDRMDRDVAVVDDTPFPDKKLVRQDGILYSESDRIPPSRSAGVTRRR